MQILLLYQCFLVLLFIFTSFSNNIARFQEQNNICNAQSESYIVIFGLKIGLFICFCFDEIMSTFFHTQNVYRLAMNRFVHHQHVNLNNLYSKWPYRSIRIRSMHLTCSQMRYMIMIKGQLRAQTEYSVSICFYGHQICLRTKCIFRRVISPWNRISTKQTTFTCV